jgi:hypothetical protein
MRSTDHNRNRHCWADGPAICVHDPVCDGECFEGMSSTCLLEHGHEGDHEWLRDDKIEVRFTSDGVAARKDEA